MHWRHINICLVAKRSQKTHNPMQKKQMEPYFILHPRKLTCPLKRDYFSITSSNHWFSGDMLVFRGVPPWSLNMPSRYPTFKLAQYKAPASATRLAGPATLSKCSELNKVLRCGQEVAIMGIKSLRASFYTDYAEDVLQTNFKMHFSLPSKKNTCIMCMYICMW